MEVKSKRFDNIGKFLGLGEIKREPINNPRGIRGIGSMCEECNKMIMTGSSVFISGHVFHIDCYMDGSIDLDPPDEYERDQDCERDWMLEVKDEKFN